jgi:hypothetical protein
MTKTDTALVTSSRTPSAASKTFRRVATSYDKLAANFLSGGALATAIAFWL